MSITIKDLVKDNTVRFESLHQGVVKYVVKDSASGSDLSFPVSLADIGDATLEAEDKAIMFMRYLRKALADGTLVAHAESLVSEVPFRFQRLRHGVAYYTNGVASFPVELAEFGDGILPAQASGSLLGDFLAKSKEEGTLVPV